MPETARGELLAFYDDALPQVFGYLLDPLRPGGVVAEDLTAETFLAAVDARPARPDPPPVSRPWLIGVARHKLVDHWRRRGREERGLRALVGRRARVRRPVGRRSRRPHPRRTLARSLPSTAPR